METMEWMDAEDREFFREKAEAFLKAHGAEIDARRAKAKAEEALVKGMANAELQEVRLGDSVIRLEVPEDDKPVYLSISYRSVLDLDS